MAIAIVLAGGSGSRMKSDVAKQFLMLKLIYEFNRLAGEAVAAYADLNEVLACSCKEKIGRAKYIEEENLSQFDEIFTTMRAELKAVAEGGAENV